MNERVDRVPWKELAAAAWRCREKSVVIHKSGTRVGAAVWAEDGTVYEGCNIEHKHHSHDIHAEIVALVTMLSSGGGRARAVIVVADRDRFTPCGACLDWIFELGSGSCWVGFQKQVDGPILKQRASVFMPQYPS